jgi:hypothetical protein
MYQYQVYLETDIKRPVGEFTTADHLKFSPGDFVAVEVRNPYPEIGNAAPGLYQYKVKGTETRVILQYFMTANHVQHRETTVLIKIYAAEIGKIGGTDGNYE